MLNARDVVDDMTESTEAGPRILNLIERDLRGIWTYNVKNNAVFRGRDMDVNGRDADRMDFLTTTDAVGFVIDSQNRPQKPTLCEVGYWFKPNPRYREVFEMWRREDPLVDGDLITQGSFQLVHDRVKNFKVTYYETLGHEAEELQEWDSSERDQLPRRIRIEFTIERRRSSRNIVSDVEIEDFEGAERTYVRHIVFDAGVRNSLQAGTARIPVFPVEPPDEAGGGGAGGAEAAMAAGQPFASSSVGRDDPMAGRGGPTRVIEGRATRTEVSGDGRGGQPPPPPRGLPGAPPNGLPNGFNLGDFLRQFGNGLGGN
jgi:hypothetical protein